MEPGGIPSRADHEVLAGDHSSQALGQFFVVSRMGPATFADEFADHLAGAGGAW